MPKRMRLALAASLGLLALGMAPRPIVLYLAGDSTMAQKLAERRPETGWGEALQQYFDIDQVRVENYARNGRSTRTFLSEGRWQAIVDRLEPGDVVFIQFGHNDESQQKTDRYTPPAEYRANLERMVADVRGKRAEPVLLTPINRRKYDAAGDLVDTHGEYPGIVRAVAKELAVPLVDLHERTAAMLEHFGPADSRELFLQLEPGENPNYPGGVHDDTHLSPEGAELVAWEAADGIRALGIPLSKYVRLPALGSAPAAAMERR